MDNLNDCSVSLRNRIEELLAFKRASGYKAEKLAKTLYRFINYAEEWEPGITIVTKNVAENGLQCLPTKLLQINAEEWEQ